MDREIKFRGKSLNDKKWVYGFYCRHDYGAHYQDKKLIKAACSVHDIWTADGWVAVDEASIGQFTGLTDLAGKEIYEGDIIKFDCGLEATISYSEVEAGFMFHYKDGLPMLIGTMYVMNEPMLFDAKVIGNVFDNPSLIPNQPTAI